MKQQTHGMQAELAATWAPYMACQSSLCQRRLKASVCSTLSPRGKGHHDLHTRPHGNPGELGMCWQGPPSSFTQEPWRGHGETGFAYRVSRPGLGSPWKHPESARARPLISRPLCCCICPARTRGLASTSPASNLAKCTISLSPGSPGALQGNLEPPIQ